MRAEEGGEKEVIKGLLREYGSEAPFVVSDTSVLGGGREAHELKQSLLEEESNFLGSSGGEKFREISYLLISIVHLLCAGSL